MNQLSDTWLMQPLGELCDVLDNKRKPITKKDRIAGDYPYYGATGILDYVENYIFDERLVLIGEDGAKWGRGDNTAFIVDGKYWVNNHAHVIRPHTKTVLEQWIVYYLNGTSQLPYITGLTVPKLNQGMLRGIPIPLPPLPEQQRIVSILDEAFKSIDQAIANTEKNLANARELFESYLNNVFTRKGDGWVENTLGEACIVERGSSPRPIKSYLTDDSDGVNWIKIGDTKKVDKLIYSTKQKITKEGAERSRFVKEGDFILSNSMSFGKPYIMATTGYIHDGWFVLRLPDEINTEYFYYLLSSRVIQNQFINLAAGAIVKNISGDLVKKATLPIPPLSEQSRLVSLFDKMSAETKSLKAIYESKLATLTELKQSILQKAFSGELTSEDIKQQVNG